MQRGLRENTGVLCLQQPHHHEHLVFKEAHPPCHLEVPGYEADAHDRYVVMRAEQRVFCTDVQVTRGASCWSDHRMVRAKLRVLPLRRQKKAPTSPITVLGLSSDRLRVEYLQKLDEYLPAEPHKPHEAASNWCTLKKCILAAAEESLGRGRKKQPEWFMEAADT